MKRTDHSVELHHTPATVWEYTTDLSRTPEWRTTITSIEPPAASASGERFTGTTRLLGRSGGWGLEVTAVEPQRRFAYKVVDGVAKPPWSTASSPPAPGAGSRCLAGSTT